MEKQTEWIPVNRMLPKMGDFVICSVAKNMGRHRIIISEYNGASYWFDGMIEAWMPLPKVFEPQEREG